MNNIIDDIKHLFEIGKKLKSEVVYIEGNEIYGSTLAYNYLTRLSFENTTQFPRLCFIVNDLNNILKGKDIQLTNCILYNENGESLNILDPVRIPRIKDMVNRVMSITTQSPIYIDEKIRDDEKFESILNLKAGDGNSLYNANGNIISIFKGLLPIAKKDKVILSLYDIDPITLLAHFMVMKSKNMIIDQYIPYLKLNN